MRPATSRGRQVQLSPGCGSIPSVPCYSDPVLQCPKMDWGEFFQHGPRLRSPREPPAPSVGTRRGALFPQHLLWVPNRNGAGTSGGRWAGRRAVPEPSAAAPPPGRASAAQPGDAAEARRIPAGYRRPPQRRGPGRRVRRLPAPSHRPLHPEAFPGGAAPGLPPRCPSSPGLLTPPPGSRAPRARPTPRTPAWRGTFPQQPTCTWRSRSTFRPMRTSWRGTKVRVPALGYAAGQGPWEPLPLPNESHRRVGTSKQQPEPALGTARCSDGIFYPGAGLGG